MRNLQEQAASLVKALAQYTITLQDLENSLLARLANAQVRHQPTCGVSTRSRACVGDIAIPSLPPRSAQVSQSNNPAAAVCLGRAQGDILEDIELIENLEETKRTAVEIEEKVAQAKTTEVSISAAREVYRPVAARGSQVYFLIDNLNALDRWVRRWCAAAVCNKQQPNRRLTFTQVHPMRAAGFLLLPARHITFAPARALIGLCALPFPVPLCSVYHYSMANYVAILKKGMDMTPGGKNEDAVPPADRLGEEVDLERRVQLLVDTTCLVLFNYVAQVSLSWAVSAWPKPAGGKCAVCFSTWPSHCC